MGRTTLKMNISVGQFCKGLKGAARRIDGVLCGFSGLPSELQEEYADQIEWMLNTAADELADLEAEVCRLRKAARTGGACIWCKLEEGHNVRCPFT